MLLVGGPPKRKAMVEALGKMIRGAGAGAGGGRGREEK